MQGETWNLCQIAKWSIGNVQSYFIKYSLLILLTEISVAFFCLVLSDEYCIFPNCLDKNDISSYVISGIRVIFNTNNLSHSLCLSRWIKAQWEALYWCITEFFFNVWLFIIGNLFPRIRLENAMCLFHLILEFFFFILLFFIFCFVHYRLFYIVSLPWFSFLILFKCINLLLSLEFLATVMQSPSASPKPVTHLSLTPEAGGLHFHRLSVTAACWGSVDAATSSLPARRKFF